MKKRIIALLLAVSTLICLVSCGENKGVTVPEGMQIVKESAEDGYVFFGPEGWKIANQGSIAATYLSDFNPVSMTFTKADMPTVGAAEEGVDEYKVSFDAYMSTGSADFPYEMSGTLSGEKISFGSSEGAADKAYRYLYSYKADEKTYSCLQVLVVRGEDFFIFTYTATGAADDSASDYNKYMAKANDAIKNFIFVPKASAPEASAPEYSKDADGYLLVSNKTLCGFDLYIPEGYTVVDNSGLVSVKISDGANFMISKATETGQSVLNYVLNRRADVIEFADKDSLEDIRISVPKQLDEDSDTMKSWPEGIIKPTYEPSMKFGNIPSGSIVAYEYSFSYGGVDYHSFQILGVTGGLFQSGYVFTYTALESEFDAHIGEIMTILEKVAF